MESEHVRVEETVSIVRVYCCLQEGPYKQSLGFKSDTDTVGRHNTASDGFSSRSAYSHDLTELLMAEMSPSLRSTDPHLNHTFYST